MMTYTAVYSQNAREEVQNFIHTRQAYIGADGNFKTSMAIDPIELVLRNLTGG